MKEMENPWKKLNSDTVHETPWIKIEQDQVITPSGKKDQYSKVHFQQKAVGALTIDQEGNIWLVGQYRYAIDQYSWEIPLGGAPAGEPALEAAQRELKEETGIVAKSWHPFLYLHPSVSSTDQEAEIFLAQEVTHGTTAPDETEVLEVKKVSLKTALQMIDNHQITEAISVAAIYKYALLKS